jgi:hypothetical protein
LRSPRSKPCHGFRKYAGERKAPARLPCRDKGAGGGGRFKCTGALGRSSSTQLAHESSGVRAQADELPAADLSELLEPCCRVGWTRSALKIDLSVKLSMDLRYTGDGDCSAARQQSQQGGMQTSPGRFRTAMRRPRQAGHQSLANQCFAVIPVL